MFGKSLSIDENDFRSWMKAASEEFGPKNNLSKPTEVLLGYPSELVLSGDRALQTNGLEETIERGLNRLRFLGENEPALRHRFQGFPELETLIRLKSAGMERFQRVGWKPNGGSRFRQRPVYRSHWEICNHSVIELANQGKALLVSKEAVKPWIGELHFSPLTWAPKPTEDGMDPMGRTCFNLSAGGRSSVNQGVDLSASDAIYPLQRLPNITDICEVMCVQQDGYDKDEELMGATVDVAKAYTQYQNSVGMSKLFATYLDCGGLWVVAIYLVGVFGFTRAGHVYCLFSRAIDYVHNRDRPFPVSLTYIDDGILIGPQRALDKDVPLYCEIVVAIFGPEACNAKKTKMHGQDLVALGWAFNLRKDIWRVGPKPRAVRKIFAALFLWLPPGSTRVENAVLRRVVSLLSWYMRAIPAGKPFLASLFACLDQGSQSRRWTSLSPFAIMDLEWLRGLSLASMKDANLFSASITSLRTSHSPTVFMWTDASTSFGGGGVLRDSQGAELAHGQMVWTDEEHAMFNLLGVSINVLEFFTAVYFILLWGHLLRGTVVQVWCDNTAAVSWLLKMRGKAKSFASLGIVKVASLYCQLADIVLCPSHIAGVDNVDADLLSRVAIQVPRLPPTSEGEEESRSSARRIVCRQLLTTSVLEPERLHSLGLLDTLSRLV
jgi:hypothetical protein